LRYLGVNERIILKLILKVIECEIADRIRLTQDKFQWLDLVNTALKLRVP